MLRSVSVLAPAALLLAISNPAQADAPHAVQTLGVTLPSGDAADVYFPEIASCEKTEYTDAFPVIAFLQGGLTDKAYYSAYATELAAFGYVVYVPNHYKALGPAPALFADGNSLNDVLSAATSADADAGSPLHLIVDTSAMGVSGHSFGGVAAVYSATTNCQPPFCIPPSPVYSRPAALKAAAVFAAHTVQGPTVLDVANDLPTALLGGSQDSRSTPAQVAATYAVLEAPRALISFDGVNHWGIADLQNPPGPVPETSAQTRPQSWSIAKIAKWTAVFFDAFVRGDAGAKKKLDRQQSENGVTVLSDL
jgi:dienelactone hydrolase